MMACSWNSFNSSHILSVLVVNSIAKNLATQSFILLFLILLQNHQTTMLTLHVLHAEYQLHLHYIS